MAEDNKIIEVVTRGFAGIRDQQQERDGKITQLSDRVLGMEFKIDQLKDTVTRIEKDVSNAETERLKARVEALEEGAKEVKERQKENAKWIKGLIASVLILLLGVLTNFIRIGLR